MKWSTAVEQAVACESVQQRARIRCPIGASFLGEVYIRDFPHLYDKCREASGSQGPRISFGRHNHSLIFTLFE